MIGRSVWMRWTPPSRTSSSIPSTSILMALIGWGNRKLSNGAIGIPPFPTLILCAPVFSGSNLAKCPTPCPLPNATGRTPTRSPSIFNSILFKSGPHRASLGSKAVTLHFAITARNNVWLPILAPISSTESPSERRRCMSLSMSSS